MVKSIIVSLAAVSLMVSCFSSRKNELSADQERYKTTVGLTYDTVWERAVSFFASMEVKIQRADKSAGLISSYEAEFPDTFRRLRQVWPSRCVGTTYALYGSTYAWYIDFYVRIKPRTDSDSTDVSISAVFYSRQGRRCVSTGEFEKSLLKYVGEGE